MALRFHLRRAAVAAALALIVGACVDTPSGPVPDAVAPGDASAGRASTRTEDEARAPITSNLAPIARYNKRPHAQDYWIKQWVGPEGGTVDFLGFRIIVPRGAVTRVTKFEIRIPGANDPMGQEHVIAEFAPHNVNFRVPVRIELPYRGTDSYGHPAGVLWYNERARVWVAIPGGITDDDSRVFAEVDHFSTYGTSGEGMLEAVGGGGTTTSGG